MTPAPSRYDRDPDALAWARGKVADLEARWREFEASARSTGKDGQAELWRQMANGLKHGLIGGDGYVIAAFDERRAGLPVPDGESG